MSRQVCGQLTLFPEDFHASRSLLQGSVEAQRMTVISGLKCSELYPNSGLLGSLVRMLLASSIWRSTQCLLTWKVKATPRGHLYYQLAVSMPRTGDTASQFWPTPMARDYRTSSGRENRQSPNLNVIVKRLTIYPTPTTGGVCGGKHALERLKAMKTAGQITETERRSMASGSGGQLNPDWVEWLMGFPVGWTRV